MDKPLTNALSTHVRLDHVEILPFAVMDQDKIDRRHPYRMTERVEEVGDELDASSECGSLEFNPSRSDHFCAELNESPFFGIVAWN